jgi:hypothetical protein
VRLEELALPLQVKRPGYWRPRRKGRPEHLTPASTVQAVLEELPTGRWFPKGQLIEIATRHQTTLVTLTTLLPLCESDSGRYVAILCDSLPMDAPDEIEQ